MAEKEVNFFKYCKTCEYKLIPDSEDPCDECLSCPYNEDSHKPVNWKDANES